MIRKPLYREVRNILFQSTVVASVGFAGSALAQNSEGKLEEVEVVGIKQSLIDNLQVKRDNAAFVDAITAEDIGKFPDVNVAESLQRVPGISITRQGGEGQFVSIRGTEADLTLTQLNGNYVASGTDGRDPLRSFNFALLPSNLIKKVEVFKSPEARIDEGGLGGTVILHTRRPLEEDANSGFVSVDTTYADVTEEHEPQFAGLYSWKNEDETFGVLASYVSQDRTAITEQITVENWHLWDDDRNALAPDDPNRPGFVRDSIAGQGGARISGYAPFAVVQRKQEEERNRESFQFTAQFKPSDSLAFNFNYFRTELEQNNDNNLLLLAEWDYADGAAVPSSVNTTGSGPIADFGTITSLRLEDPDLNDPTIDLQAPAIGARQSFAKSSSDTFDFEVEYTSDFVDVILNFGKTEAEGGKSFDALQRFSSQGGNTSAYGWDLNAGTTISGDTDPTDFGSFGWRSSDAGTNTDEETYFQLDTSFKFDSGVITSIDTGVKVRDHEINRTLVNQIWDDGDPNNATLWGGCCGLGDEWWHTNESIPAVEAVAATGAFFSYVDTTGEAGTQGSFLTLDWDKWRAYLDENFTRTTRVNDEFFFNVKEKINSAYVQANFETGALSGNFGVRVVETEQTAETFDAIGGLRASELNTNEGSYTDVLPSLNVKYDINDTLLARFSAAKTVGRVDYTDLGTSESYSQPADGSTETAGSAGNPNLEPFQATQYDLGLEWYFGEGSYLGGGIFRKDIESFVLDNSYRVVRTNVPGFEGQPITINFAAPVNLTDANAQGFELAYQQAFSSGFGLILNYTYTDTSRGAVTAADGQTFKEIPLPGTSPNQYNISGFYENDKLSARISYNYRDEFALDRIENDRTPFTTDRSQIDVNATYYITDDLTLNASIINLTKELDETYLGQEEWLSSRSYSGRRFNMGLLYKF